MADLDAFGTLSFDEDSDDFEMAPEFESLQAAFWATRSAYVASQISHTTAAERFRALRLISSSGEEWTLGATSSSWYSRVPGGRWEKAAVPPVGVVPDRSALPSWVTKGVESLAADEEGPQDAARDASAFNPFQRKSTPLLESASGNVRPSAETDLGWVYEDWDDEVDFSDGVPGSIDPGESINQAADDRPPVPRKADPGFDIDSLFVRPE